MTDPNGSEDRSRPPPASVENVNKLSATNAQVGNAAQIIGSPGAVVNQVHIEYGSAVSGILAGMFGVILLVLVAVLPFLGKLVPTGLAVFLVGLSAALIVGGFFIWVESLLVTATKEDVAGWLVGVEVGKKVEPWPETFTTVFNRVFGPRSFSWRSFWASSIATVFVVAIVGVVIELSLSLQGVRLSLLAVDLAIMAPAAIIPDYCSLALTRFYLSKMRRHLSLAWLLGLALVAIVTSSLAAFLTAFVVASVREHVGPHWWIDLVTGQMFGDVLFYHYVGFVASLFTSIWLWLYACAGLILIAAKRFDLGFRWFNSKFDVKKKPLSAIGLVAGALVAIVYWGTALGAYLLK